MIDEINELPEDGLKSRPKRGAIEKINGLVEKIKKICTCYTLLILTLTDICPITHFCAVTQHVLLSLTKNWKMEL